MWFDKFADWVTEQNIAAIGFGMLLILGSAFFCLKTAWGKWKSPD